MKLIFKNTQPNQFLHTLSPHSDIHVFQTFTDNKEKRKKNDKLAKQLIGTFKQHSDELRKLNKQGAGIFVTVQETDGRGRKKENIASVRTVFIEDDDANVPALPIRPHMVVQTSPNKHHYYFLTEKTNVSKFSGVQQTLVDKYGSDRNAKDLSRVLRIPGFYHMKGKPQRVELIKIREEFARYSWKEIEQAFPPTEPKKKKKKVTNSHSGRRVLGTKIENVAEIYSALQLISPDIEYQKWLSLGQALHSVSNGHKEALTIWDEWSKFGDKYQPDGCKSRWSTFSAKPDDPVTINTLFKIAKKSGWDGSYATNDKGIEYAQKERNRRLGAFGRKLAVANIEGKTLIISRKFDTNTDNWKTEYSTFTHMSEFHETSKVPRIEDTRGIQTVERIPIFKEWRNNASRRQYSDIEFKPQPNLFATDDQLPDTPRYNLYQGLNITPGKGDCSLIKQHIRNIWCDNNKDAYSYVIKWMARMFQSPGERGHSIIVLKSIEGAGKNIISNIFEKAFGSHAYTAVKPDDITGNFNDHLATAVFLLFNEAVWGGDKNKEGILKSLATDENMIVEKKYLPKFAVKNCTHIMMFSNNEWVAPIGSRDRRYLVLDMNNSKAGNRKYFDKLAKHIDTGGAEAFIHYLLNLDISKFNPRDIPDIESETKLDNILRTSTSVVQWWYECLQEGAFYERENSAANTISDGAWRKHKIRVGNKQRMNSYQTWCKDNGNYSIGINSVTKQLSEMNNGILKDVKVAVFKSPSSTSRSNGKQFRSLNKCRKAFREFLGVTVPWNK